MRQVGAYEAKTHLPRLLDEVAAGATITITKHGVPVALLVPPTARVLPTCATPSRACAPSGPVIPCEESRSGS